MELKNSTIGNGTKISHLTFVGDTDLGERINLGCGTVTVNYDGKSKYRCTVEDDCFIGCNTNMVAPVTIGKGSYVAAGSTITDQCSRRFPGHCPGSVRPISPAGPISAGKTAN